MVCVNIWCCVCKLFVPGWRFLTVSPGEPESAHVERTFVDVGRPWVADTAHQGGCCSSTPRNVREGAEKVGERAFRSAEETRWGLSP